MMDEADRLIIDVVQNLGCDTEDTSSLKQLSTELVIEGIVRCLWKIAPDTRKTIESCKMPPNMTARFRLATEVASAIKNAGYRSDVGYQTLLYGSEGDIRRIFVFLIENLPKESSAMMAKDLEPLEQAKLETGARLKAELEAPWVPWFCRRHRYRWDGRFWCPTDKVETVPFRAHKDLSVSVPWRDIPATIFENWWRFSEKEAEGLLSELHLQKALTSQKKAGKKPFQRRIKPKLLPKPKLEQAEPAQNQEPERIELITQTQAEDSAETLHAQAEAVHAELNNLYSKISGQKEDARMVRRNISQLEAEIRSKEAEVGALNRFSFLLKKPQENLQRLQNFVDQSETRLSRLEEQWTQASLPKHKELAHLREKLLHQGPAGNMMTGIESAKTRRAEILKELDAKQAYHLQLEYEFSRMGSGVSRTAYTKRILEIVASVRKQRDEIDRVLEDTRLVQKEINMLTGNLERTFTAVEEKLYDGATSDELMKSAYRMVVNVHEICAKLVSEIENIGHVKREIQELTDMNETEVQKSTDANLEKLVNDFFEIKEENEKNSRKILELGP